MDRKEFTKEVEEYANSVPSSYPELAITSDHFYVEVTAKQKNILGNARTTGGSPYKPARIGISWDAYQNRDYSWERVKETTRHEIVHVDNWFVHGYMGHGPTFRELAKSVGVENIDSRYENKHDPRYQYVKPTDGTASWTHYNCKKLRRKQRDDRYVVFPADQYEIREISSDWKESCLTAGLQEPKPTVDLIGGEVGAAADE